MFMYMKVLSKREIVVSKRWIIQTNSTPSHFIEAPVPSHDISVMKAGGLALQNLIQPTISLEMPVPSQGHYGFHSFLVVD